MKNSVPKLLSAVALNVGVGFMLDVFVGCSTVSSQVRFALITGILATISLGLTLPLLWRAKPWQRVVAAMLSLLPCYSLAQVLQVSPIFWRTSAGQPLCLEPAIWG
jgi:hypothetical protein